MDAKLKQREMNSYTIVEFIPVQQNQILAAVFVIHIDTKIASYNIAIGSNLLEAMKHIINVFKGKSSVTGNGSLTALRKALQYMISMEKILKSLGMEYVWILPLSKDGIFRYIERFGYKPMFTKHNKLFFSKRL